MLITWSNSFPISLNKMPKWQSYIRNKIKPQMEIQQTIFFWQTKNTQRYQMSWAPSPNFGLANFHKNVLAAIWSSMLWAGST